MRHDSTTSCACKRSVCPSLMEPACAPVLYAGQEKTGILFVRRREDVECPHLRSYSYGEFCTSTERIEDYLSQPSDAPRTFRAYPYS